MSNRKFTLAIICLVLIALLTVSSVISPAVAGVLPAAIGGILGVLAFYSGSNVAQKALVKQPAIPPNENGEA